MLDRIKQELKKHKEDVGVDCSPSCPCHQIEYLLTALEEKDREHSQDIINHRNMYADTLANLRQRAQQAEAKVEQKIEESERLKRENVQLRKIIKEWKHDFLQIQQQLATARKALEDIKLWCEASVCDCGEPMKETDCYDYVAQALKEVGENE